MSPQQNSIPTGGGTVTFFHILQQHFVGRSIYLHQWTLKEDYWGQKAGTTGLSINGPDHPQKEWVITGKVPATIKEIWVQDGTEGFIIRVDIAGEEQTFPVHPHDALYYA